VSGGALLFLLLAVLVAWLLWSLEDVFAFLRMRGPGNNEGDE
jgi:hypothetical protein